MVSPGYNGQSFYIDTPSVADNNLITASSTGALLWAKQIIEHLGVFQSDDKVYVLLLYVLLVSLQCFLKE